ncbi:POTRA domain-containing protein [Granulicella cerasi]|uniref:POTRA domain-containing protein n=1 Tax=Granulicella cerasi TaxID=741063 RepID=A0ABW1ZC12_9BACT|nr:POTRA domain-containing protein [Granulicella cerasi]
MSLQKKLSLLSLSACFVVAPAFAQTWVCKRVEFKNPGTFSQAQLEAAAGLHPGMSFTVQSLTDAAQKLADTGFFDNVTAGVTGTPTNRGAEFVLKPTDVSQYLPLGFENLVWLTPEEVQAAIRAKLPLYNGRLMEGSTQLDDVDVALVAALAAKGVQAKVVHDTAEPTLVHPVRVVEYRVSKPQLTVENVKLGGVTTALVPLLQKSVNATAHKPYNAGLGGDVTSEVILLPLRDAGYAKASLSDVSLEPPTAVGNHMGVVLHATLAAGDVYKIGAVNFAGTPLMSSEDFAKGVKLHAGDVASEKLLRESLKPLDDAYRSKGYMDVVIVATPTFDEAAKTVSYAVAVTPGEVYKLNKANTDGLDPKAQADFDKYFKVKQGDAFDSVYVSGFIKNNTAIASLAPYTGTWKTIAYPATHTVDVYLSFFQSGRKVQTITVR